MKTLSKITLSLASLLACATAAPAALAHEGDGGAIAYASDHAPIGVMADHRHKAGEWMVSARYMYMDMSGSRDGTTPLPPEAIVTGVANPFANPPMSPPTLRVVPLSMPMHMAMVGAMYGLTDRVTLMAMGMFAAQSMDHVTFQGPTGSTRLGEFTTRSSGVGDTTIGAIIGLDRRARPHDQTNLAIALSIPTGSIGETDDVLTPMGTRPTLRLPYPMQLGSGSFDFRPSLTTRRRLGRFSLGAQGSAVIRLASNDAGYALGDVYAGTLWAAFEPAPSISVSGRIRASTASAIKGNDALVRAPVQTADPANHGGEIVEALVGVNFAGSHGWVRGHRLAVEVGLPLHRDLNGPQLETDLTLTVGWQKAF